MKRQTLICLLVCLVTCVVIGYVIGYGLAIAEIYTPSSYQFNGVQPP